MAEGPTSTELGITGAASGSTALLERPARAEASIAGLSNAMPDRALATFASLERSEEALPVIGAYSDVLQRADESLPVLEAAFHDVQGMNLVPEVARNNLSRQANLLLGAAEKIRERGRATVPLFGKYRTFERLEDIVTQLDSIKADFEQVGAVPTDLDTFVAKGLPIVDKYLFDTKDAEAREEEARILVLEDNYRSDWVKRLIQEGKLALEDNPELQAHLQPGFTEELQKEGILSEGAEPTPFDGFEENPFQQGTITRSSIRALQGAGLEHFLRSGSTLPDVVIVQVDSPQSFPANHNSYQQLFRDYWGHLKPHERPAIIFYTNGFEPPLYEQSSYEGFLFCSTMDELRSTMQIARDLASYRKGTPGIEPTVLASLQESQYDNSFDLREWEHITADTYQSLKHILRAFKRREEGSAEEVDEDEEVPQDTDKAFEYLLNRTRKKEIAAFLRQQKGKVRTVADFGTGDGRIAGALARIGYRVVGLDISEEQLKRGQARLQEEGEGLRGEKDHPGLSYHALRRLEDEGVLPQRPTTTDEETRRRYVTLKGNFHSLHYDLNELINNWHTLHPDLGERSFFNVDPFNKYAFQEPRNQFLDIGFDAAMFNWHTFCEINGIDKQQDVLRQVMNILNPGGIFILEIPDRTVDPYASLIREYHETHPDARYGTRQDVYEDETGREHEYTPRYFSGRSEIVTLLQAVGFEVKPEEDVETYLITSDNEETGKKTLQAKELFIVAQRPWS